MGCNSCANLDTKAKKSGAVDGCLYYCKLKKSYVNCATDCCESYKDGYRSSFECNELYRNSRNYNDDDTQVETYVFILILIIICGLTLKIFT